MPRQRNQTRIIGRKRINLRGFLSAQVFVFDAGAQRNRNGDIAQLVERLNGIQEVMGSIPTISTRPRIYGIFQQVDTVYLGVILFYRKYPDLNIANGKNL